MLQVLGSAVASILVTVIIMLLLRRVSHRLRIGRRLVDLIGQDQYEFIILDVRSPQDYHDERIQGALNLPLAEIEMNLPTEKMFEPIYVYGRSWKQARQASRLLDETGYFNVTCYGGIRGWNGPRETGKDR